MISLDFVSLFSRVIIIILIYISANNRSAIADSNENTFYFADLHACAISGDFLELDCKKAFANSREELLDRMKPFNTVNECRAYYFLCLDKNNQNDTFASSSNAQDRIIEYFPQMIGIEIIKLPKDIKARPILGIDVDDKNMPFVSISTPYKVITDTTAQNKLIEQSGILLSHTFSHTPNILHKYRYLKFISF